MKEGEEGGKDGLKPEQQSFLRAGKNSVRREEHSGKEDDSHDPCCILNGTGTFQRRCLRVELFSEKLHEHPSPCMIVVLHI